MLSSALISLILVTLSFAWQPSGTVVFEDSFEGDSLDLSKWEIKEGHSAYGFVRLQCYTKENIVVSDNQLTIKAEVKEVECDAHLKQQKRLKYTSARIQTRKAYDFTSIEIVAKTSKGSHLQPALWTQAADRDKGIYEELDIMEQKGTFVGKLYQSGHWGKNWTHLHKNSTYSYVDDMSADFHRFGMEKTSTDIIFYFDGEEKRKLQRNLAYWNDTKIDNIPNFDFGTPFDQPAKLIINLAVGGNWFIKDGELSIEIAQEWEKPSLEVKSVKIFNSI
ncbi:hypothetical protein B4U80_11838 [Leptotrombidium deliense]|uniref:GH16 domain-containing protein n=1 Tax=Leptotrombidium deliense TaxID=299467 RepID=A0A443S1Z6_9ACAR|nr:hypothetical protein B4U80_11838 [Leptotrombidium deliense]